MGPVVERVDAGVIHVRGDVGGRQHDVHSDSGTISIPSGPRSASAFTTSNAARAIKLHRALSYPEYQYFISSGYHDVPSIALASSAPRRTAARTVESSGCP